MLIRKIRRSVSFISGFSSHQLTEASTERFFLLNQKGQFVSYWQDVPFKNDTKSLFVNAVIEIPQKTFGKLQVLKTEPFHPITIDSRKIDGKPAPRFYQQPLLFNYGYIPQTWENSVKPCSYFPSVVGDNDPIDVVEISDRVISQRQPFEAVVLGSLPLIDQGEMDWKVLIINRSDAERLKVFDLRSAMNHFKDKIKYIQNWFIICKELEGKALNTYTEPNKIFDEVETEKIIQDTHREYHELIKKDEYANFREKFHLKQSHSSH